MAAFLPAAAISHFTPETDVAECGPRSVSADAGVHRAADSVTENCLPDQASTHASAAVFPLGCMPLRMKTGKLTLRARGFYSNTPTESKLVTATYSMNGTVIPECQFRMPVRSSPAASGALHASRQQDGKTADAIIKVR